MRHSKPIRVFWSPLSETFYASRSYKEDPEKGFVTITGEKFDVTQDIASLIEKHDIVFSKPNKKRISLERWGVHYDSLPHTCYLASSCDCNCSGCRLARGFDVEVVNGQCVCGNEKCQHCGRRNL